MGGAWFQENVVLILLDGANRSIKEINELRRGRKKEARLVWGPLTDTGLVGRFAPEMMSRSAGRIGRIKVDGNKPNVYALLHAEIPKGCDAA